MMRRKMTKIAASLAGFCLLASAAQATDASQAYKSEMDQMNAAMTKGMDSDSTKAFVKMMIAHHQGAIDMSKTVLTETKDPMIRDMAEKGIADQTKEQAMLRDWLSKHGG